MVEGYAQLRGFLYYHTWRSDHSAAGFPDYVLTRNGRLVFAELKRVGAKTTPRQREWLWALAECLGPGHVFLWTVREWPQAIEVLR